MRKERGRVRQKKKRGDEEGEREEGREKRGDEEGEREEG